MIEVTGLDDTTFQVKVEGPSSTTSHRVTVDQGYAERIAPGVAPEALVEESFRFLLEREPNTSILRAFDLPVIGRYFPEYETEISRRFR